MLKKLLAFYTRFFAVWVMLLAIVAYFWPAPFIVHKLVMVEFWRRQSEKKSLDQSVTQTAQDS